MASGGKRRRRRDPGGGEERERKRRLAGWFAHGVEGRAARHGGGGERGREGGRCREAAVISDLNLTPWRVVARDDEGTRERDEAGRREG